MDESNEWELSKENVQPLRQGRKMASLTAGLQPQNEQRIRNERQCVYLRSVYLCQLLRPRALSTFRLVQIFRRIHAYSSFHIYLSDILHFSFLMHVTSKRGPYSFM